VSVVHAEGLGRRYGRRWALRDCSIEIDQGSVVALVGPNGAGKTTLLHLAAGLSRPTSGTVRVFDGDPATDTRLLARIGLVAQDTPLYRSFTVRDMLRAGRAMNHRWDDAHARRRLAELSIPLDQRCGSLSGGQRAQVALAVALGKRPDLLLLDEPLASLDPLARRAFMQTLMVCAAEDEITIVLSSHLITDLERACDHLIILADGRVRTSGAIDALLAEHRSLTGPNTRGRIAGVAEIIDATRNGNSATLIARLGGTIHDPQWAVDTIGLEELVLAYLSGAAESLEVAS
jgi:ABC-2 type transport system ATP-binding protein